VGVFKTRLLVLDSPAALRKSVFGRKVVFHLGDAKDCMVDGLLQLPFVQEAKRVDNKLILQLDDPDKNNPEVVRYLVDGGVDIQFIGELRYSLEEVYLQLVKNA
jgi:ABC-2 type transport system ATP-binding protein